MYNLLKIIIFFFILFSIYWIFDERKKYIFNNKPKNNKFPLELENYVGNNIQTDLVPQSDFAKLLKKINKEYSEFYDSFDNYCTLEDLNRDVDPYDDLIDPLDPANEQFFKGKSISDIYDSQVNLYKNRTQKLHGYDNQYMNLAYDNNNFTYKNANFGNEF